MLVPGAKLVSTCVVQEGSLDSDVRESPQQALSPAPRPSHGVDQGSAVQPLVLGHPLFTEVQQRLPQQQSTSSDQLLGPTQSLPPLHPQPTQVAAQGRQLGTLRVRTARSRSDSEDREGQPERRFIPLATTSITRVLGQDDPSSSPAASHMGGGTSTRGDAPPAYLPGSVDTCE